MRMARETGLQVSQEVLQELGGHYMEANIRKTANSLRGTNFEIDEGEWKRVLGETLDKSILGALAFVTPTASINFGLELKSYKEGRARFEHLPGGKEFFTLLDKDATAGTFDTVIENSSHKLNDRVKINIGDLPEDIRVKIEKGELSKTDLNEYNLEDSKIEKLLNLSSDFKDHIEAGKFRSNVLEQSGTKLNAEQELFKNNLEVSFLLTSDSNIRLLNKNYRNKDKSTNVLAFPMNQKSFGENFIVGDVVISLQKILSESKKLKIQKYKYLSQITIHGVLHLSGHSDKSIKEKKIMSRMEENILKETKWVDIFEK